MENKKILLFDIDNTLFDGIGYREKLFRGLAKKANHTVDEFVVIAEDVYFQLRKTSAFIPDIYAKMLAERLSLTISSQELESVIWDEEILRVSLFEEVEQTLEVLSQYVDLQIGIFSSGPHALQKAKVKVIEKYFSAEHSHIFLAKEENIPLVIEKYKNNSVYVVDDLLKVLMKLKSQSADIVTIWSKRGTWANKQKELEKSFTPDYIIKDLREVITIIKKPHS